ncbi:MAE_28990/MAE_18760 family HEPN-like nuclease [Azotobacter chroococcum]|uniref:MAE_28990/MAE_18760 family HEPN-like nuclease n=1 Tax=Azotobacter chroococcum TaxID=353 RepID=UPI0011854C34|nr:MAE_28990/MAE_18760 family HEPN-like nuclease [Azotobacter chroococcum]
MILEEFEILTAELVDSRRAEMTQVMRVFGNFKKTTLEGTAAIMAVPVIYAHWEGFVKELLTLYLEYIEKQTIPPPGLHPHLFSFSMKSKIKLLSESGSVERYSEFASWMIEQLSRPIAFESKKIETNSNLSYENLKALCDTLYIDVTAIAQSKKHINSLVNRRNNIAHTGRPLKLDEEDVERDRALAMRLIETFSELVLQSARAQSFRSSAA